MRLHELERVVESGLASFLAVGRALREIKDSGLYREYYATFGQYCTLRWGLSGHRGQELIRSTVTAEHLLAGPAAPGGDAPLPPNLPETVMRPLSKLRPELQTECWRLATRITEKPTHFVVSKIVRTVTSAIAEGCGNGGQKLKRSESEVTVFMRPIYLLSRAKFPAAELIICHFEDEQQASRCRTACRELIARCETLIAELNRKFPELESSS